jgi:lipopolysaccharide/colanic/teichoic acid biosynthesis glycosyltransferase
MFSLSMLRLEYSTVQFAASYTIAVGYFLFVHLFFVSQRRLVLGFVPGGATDSLPSIGRVEWHRIISPDAQLPSLAGVVVDLGNNHSDAWSSRIAAFALEGLPVHHAADVTENLTGRVEIRHLSENTLGSLNPNDVYFLVRRVIDALLSASLLVLLMPVFLLASISIKLDSPGPVFFKQARVGFRNRVFTDYKFRTMVSSLAPVLDRHTAITRVNDPRITQVGRILRKFRIDELPQLINVIKGDMGLIGPRPEVVALSKWYETEIPFYHYRHIIKPGITGWAQVRQGHVSDLTDVSQKLHLDFYYVKNFSFWLDVLIVLKTIRVILRGTGAK